MNTTATTPNIEKVKAQEMSVTLRVEMTLASIPVAVSGQYNIHSNCYYPSTVELTEMNLFSEDDKLVRKGHAYDLETFCKFFGWDYYLTHDEMQAAVEKRDQ